MKITLNGEEKVIEAEESVQQLVDQLVEGDSRGVAVAVDEEVVPRSEWSKWPLKEGSRVEVLRAIQGG